VKDRYIFFEKFRFENIVFEDMFVNRTGGHENAGPSVGGAVLAK